MKKIAILLIMLISLSAFGKRKLNLENGDVRKCLIESAEQEGWTVLKPYYNKNGKLVIVVYKGSVTRKYVSK